MCRRRIRASSVATSAAGAAAYRRGEDFGGGFLGGFWAVGPARITRRDQWADYAKAGDRSARIRDCCRTDVPILVDAGKEWGDPSSSPAPEAGSATSARVRGIRARQHRNPNTRCSTTPPPAALLTTRAGTGPLLDPLWQPQLTQPRAPASWPGFSRRAACRNGGSMLRSGVACNPRSDRGTRSMIE